MDVSMLSAHKLAIRDVVMESKPVEEYTARYVVIKNSWKGKYARIFCIGPRHVATIDAHTLSHITNVWDYRTQLVDVVPNLENMTDFKIIICKGSKNETVSFSCNSAMERAELLSDVHRNQLLLNYTNNGQFFGQTFAARKYCFNESYRNCHLRVTRVAVEQLDAEGNVIGEYLFTQIKGLTSIIDNPQSFLILYGPQMKMHLYEVENPKQVTSLIEDFAGRLIGLPRFRKMRLLSQQQFDSDRLGVDRVELASTAEFPVMKWSQKHRNAPLRRILATAKKCVVELDPETYNPISAFFFADIHALIRCEEDDQRFVIHFKEPDLTKIYTSLTRDTLLAHLVDCCRMWGNFNVCVVPKHFSRGKRLAPSRVVVPEEIESTLLNLLVSTFKGNGLGSEKLLDVVEFFNTNVHYSGLRFTENRDGVFAENREKLIFNSLVAFLDYFSDSDVPYVVAQQFYVLRRLCVTRIGFSSAAIVPSIIEKIKFLCSKALTMNNNTVSHAVIDFLNVLMTPHHNHYELQHEEANKSRILKQGELLDHMLQMLHDHTKANTAALVVQALLDFFVYALCPPYSETTDASLFATVMKKLLDKIGKELFTLMQHGCGGISYSAGQLIRVIMEEGSSEQFAAMQQSALSKGGILGQLHLAIYSKNHELRSLARQLVAYWAYDNSDVQSLLRGIFPLTLLSYLKSKEEVPNDEKEMERQRNVVAMSDEFWQSKLVWFKKRFYPTDATAAVKSTGQNLHGQEKKHVCKRQRNLNVKLTLNWSMFFYQVKQDHMRPDLIWNHATRDELREALETEMEALKLGLGLYNDESVSWNFREFEVQYLSLKDELKIGQHYPRLLFETKEPVVRNPKDFFFDMYHSFLITELHKTRLSCLHGMRILYEHYGSSIGQFNDMGHIIKLLETAMEPAFRDHLLLFILQLLCERLNVKLFLDCDGLKVLVELLTLAHLDVDRPQMYTSTSAIESVENKTYFQEQAKEWYYIVDGVKQEPVSYIQLKEMYTNGEITNNTKIWAQGLSGWIEFKDVPQLRWGIIVEKKNQLFTLTEVSCVILDILLKICAFFPSRDVQGAIMQPLSRVKRYLSSPQVLPHIVQLLLTFNPEICSRVYSLLYSIMMDNPVMPRLFLTGVFFFAFMYTGSDLMPLSQLLHLTHSRQAFMFDHDNEVVRLSILNRLLPPALVCVLEKHGPERFADVLLGEYETPEAIWGKYMRHYLLEKISSHISDFTPRLFGNNRAIYQYCPIVDVVYETLEQELFCSQYYLRHFCDEVRYPNWPVNDPIAFLRDVLAAWRRELDKKPSELTVESCLKELDISSEADITLQMIRSAYHKMAMKYHPDKNPDGRSKFERIHMAYEFLALGIQSGAAFARDSPNPRNIALLLRTQSILLRRFNDIMVKYKYAGYGLLLKLIKLEYEDPEMLRKEVVLMEPATELCYFTVRNLPLNSDELQEEGGIELLSRVMQRCFELITPNDTDDLIHVKIARHCMHTFCVAAEFADCRKRLVAESVICHFAARGIMNENAVSLSRACIQACKAFCVDETLQSLLLKSGVIWYLLLFLFRYDYTLQDSGVNVQEEHHTQFFTNKAAVYALQAIYALAGIRPSDAYVKTNPNVKVIRLLQRLLTPYLVKKMQMTPDGEEEILKMLNSTHETPYLLWNNSNIRELESILKNNAEKYLNAGTFTEELSSLTDYNLTYSLHKGELIIAGVFVRIYNEQPTFPIEDPVGFCASIIKFIECQQSNEYTTAGVALALEAAKNLLNAYTMSSLITVLAQKADVLLNVLLFKDSKITTKGAELLEKVSLNHTFVEAVGKIEFAITNVILALDCGGDAVEPCCLAFLRVALGDRGVVQQVLDRGLYVVLLYIIGKTANQKCRENACAALVKSFMDKLCGQKLFLRASKLIPAVILETMKESVVNGCHLLDTWQETPELVWTKERKDGFLDICEACQKDIVATLKKNPKAYWNIPDNIIKNSDEEIQIGGVYLDRYLKQAGWKVRKPTEFFALLLERFMEECGRTRDMQNADLIVLITDVALRLLQTSPIVTDSLVSLGYVQKLLKLVESDDVVVADNALKWMREACASCICVEAFVNIDPIFSLLVCLRAKLQRIALILDTMERLFSRSSGRSNMVSFALHNKLPQYLLGLLETGLTHETCGNRSPSAVRALIIKVLKAMVALQDPVYGPQLEAILAERSVWAKYKDQSHELFLSDVRFGGYLEDPVQQQQKLLPAYSFAPASHNANDFQPPPL